MRLAVLLSATVVGLAACATKAIQVNPSDYYAPKIVAHDKLLTISIPVEVKERDGKKSFVKLFALYGFSGNGPSIEQVVRRNLSDVTADFNSEGDAFVMRVSNKTDYVSALQKLKCVEDVACLTTWLENSRSVLIKE